MINELVVRGDPSEVAKLVDRIKVFPQNGWKREPDLEERLGRGGEDPRETFCFRWEGAAGKPAATLIFRRWGVGELSVSHIIPQARTPLSDEEYNDILSEFEQDILRPHSRGVGVETIVIPPLARLEASLSPEALRRLKSFSSKANKSDPHPFDWRRWDQFLIQIHQDGSVLDDTDLALLLASQGWTESQSGRFVEHFRAGQSLLATYDEERPAS